MSEGLTGSTVPRRQLGRYLDKSHEIDRYNGAFTDTWSSALDDQESRSRLHQAAKEMSK